MVSRKNFSTKTSVTLLAVIFTACCHAQTSFSFMSPLPPDSERLQAVDQAYFGIYKSDSSDIVYEFNAAGVFTRSMSVVTIPMETIRETSLYQISGNYIHGIIPQDSLPYVLDGDYYYVGIQRRDTLVSKNSKNELRKIANGEYVLNFFENGTYVPCLLNFKSSNLSIRFFDYDNDQTFSAIRSKQSKQEEQLTNVFLLPTLKEWKKMDSSLLFGKPTEYKSQEVH